MVAAVIEGGAAAGAEEKAIEVEVEAAEEKVEVLRRRQ